MTVAAPLPENSSSWTEVRKNHAFMDLLNDLESRFPVDEWVIDGVHAWPVARLHLYYSFFDFQYFAQEPVRAGVIKPADVLRLGLRVARGVGGFIRASISDWRGNQATGGPYHSLFLNYNTYMTPLNGAWHSRVCDPFREQLKERGLSSLMLTAGYSYSVPRYSKSVFIQPQLVAYRLAGMMSRRRARQSPQLGELEAYAKASGLFAHSFALAGPVERTVAQIRGIARYFSRALAAASPKLVFVTCWYNTESMACVLACTELGIPCVDIQHGSQGFHVGYVRWRRVPATGYNLLPSFFWCWSATEAAAITDWSQGLQVHQPVVGGNLFLDRWILGNDETVRGYDKTMEDLKQRSAGAIQVLYTLNGSTKDEITLLGEIISAVNAEEIAAHFWVRLHPIALDQKDAVRETLEAKGARNVDVDHGTLLPLYALLRHVDVHVTEFSSVVLEAQSFGVPSVIAELGVINYPDQIASGWAVTARTVPEWVNGIRFQADRRGALAEQQPVRGVVPKGLDALLNLASRTPVPQPSRT